MTAAYHAEFETVDLILASRAKMRAVDAFALSLIKGERQLRRLVTYLVFQSPSFSVGDVEGLKRALWESNRVYFEGFERGFDALYQRSIGGLIGPEYPQARGWLVIAAQYRNKIFHGQLTPESLSRDALLRTIHSIRNWCQRLALSAEREIGYDGFQRDSFRKSAIPHFANRLRIQLTDLDSYRRFIRQYLERPR
jgi:hypothetical protein